MTKKNDKSSPSHVVYQVRDRENDKAIWTRVGAAWRHQDGKGFNVQLSAYPVGGRLTIREPLPEGESEGAQA